MKKAFLYLSTLIFILSCDINGITPPDLSNLIQNENITGLWLECWNHNGTMYSPGSYGAAKNPNFETFYYFKSDGTGYFIERYMNINSLETGELYSSTISQITNNNDITYTVTSEDSNGNWIEKDELHIRWKLYWGITNDNKLNLFKENHNGELIETLHDFNYDPIDPRSGDFIRTIDFYELGIEIQIPSIGSLKKVGDIGENELVNHYLLN